MEIFKQPQEGDGDMKALRGNGDMVMADRFKRYGRKWALKTFFWVSR